MKLETIFSVNVSYWPISLLCCGLILLLLALPSYLVTRSQDSNLIKLPQFIGKLNNWLAVITFSAGLILMEIGYVWIIIEQPIYIAFLAIILIAIAIYYSFDKSNTKTISAFQSQKTPN
jgi:hypothetical protein